MTATLAPDQVTPPAEPPGAPRRSRREHVGLAALLLGTAVLYLVNLSANGWANDFYSAAVASMTKSWEAFFFGSFDAGNTVTVDKPPASLWVMALSERVFGVSSWSLLVPEALMGVASVALLYAAVRRVAGSGAGLLAGAVLALTPVAALMFRFDNPDALLVLLMVAAAYAVTRAVERAGTRWLLLAGALLGLAFLAKSAQALVVLPALALAYLWAAPTGLWRRVWQLLAAGGAMVVTAGWWFLAVALWPAADRPYIGGSTTNSALELAFGYNGLGRIFGEGRGGGGRAPEAGAALPGGVEGGPGGFGGGGFGGGGGPFGGNAGLGRLFAADVGGQVAWLLPTALVLLVVGIVLVGRAGRTDRLRASLLLWGGWTVVTVLVFSLMQGIFHQYYTVALAPGIAALVGIGGALLWRRREVLAARIAMAALVLLTAGWSWVLLDRASEFAPWVRWTVVVVGVLGAVAFLLPVRGRVVAAAALVAAVVSGLLGPSAYAVQTVATAHTGSIPLAGPSTGSGFGGFGGPGGFGTRGNRTDRDRTGSATADRGVGAPGGFGGGESQASDPALVSLLQAAGTKWSAATVSTMSAAPLALASGTDVMAIGGFSGSDPAPTLAQFQADVAAGQVRYFIVGGGPGGGGPGGVPGGAAGSAGSPSSTPGGGTSGSGTGGSTAGSGTGGQTGDVAQNGRSANGGGFGGRGSAISTWVEQHYTSTTVGGRTVYDLTKPTA